MMAVNQMLFSVVVALSLTTILGKTLFFDHKDTPRVGPCCFAHSKFETAIFQTYAYEGQQGHGFAETAAYLIYDSTERKQALYFRTRREGHEDFHAKIIRDYNIHREYFLHDERCTYRNGSYELRPPCVPDDARNVFTVKVGLDAESIVLNTFEFKGRGEDDVIFFTNTNELCAPDNFRISGTNEYHDRFVYQGQYSNITLGIRDPDVFTPPSHCEPQQPKNALFSHPFLQTVLFLH